MLHVILFQPDIAPNTGNIGRMCAVTQSRLHLIHPLGFEITEKRLRRAGMDYWKQLDVVEHADWQAFIESDKRPPDDRIFLLSTKGQTNLWDNPFADGDGLLFGKETAGAPPWLHEWAQDRCLQVPQPNPNVRSLNLATCAGIVTYEAMRQISKG